MQQTSIPAFMLMSAFAAASPGPDVLVTVANGIRHGLRGAGIGLIGTVLSHALAISSLSLGTNVLLAASPAALFVLEIAGAIYLAIVSLSLLRSCGISDQESIVGQEVALSDYRLFRRAFVVAITNPKAWLFFIALMPQFISAAEPMATQYAVLAIYFSAIESAVLLSYAVIAINASRFLYKPENFWIDRAFGVALMCLAISLFFNRIGFFCAMLQG